MYWKAQTQIAEQGAAGLKGWSAVQAMSIVASWNIKAAVKLKLEAELDKNKVDGVFLARLTCKDDLKKLKGMNVGLRTALWTNLAVLGASHGERVV